MSTDSTRTLVFCDDSAHPASLTRDGLAALGETGLALDWVEDPAAWRTESLAGYHFVIFSKANNRSQEKHEPWADEETGRAFAAYVSSGNGILFLHSGTALYGNSPSLCKLMGGAFTSHPPQCPVTVEPLAGHPLTAGFATFTLMDEHYMMEMNDPDVDLFLFTESEHGRQPAGWTRSQGKGRVGVLTPGHNPEVWRHPSYQALLRNCIAWCKPNHSTGE